MAKIGLATFLFDCVNKAFQEPNRTEVRETIASWPMTVLGSNPWTISGPGLTADSSQWSFGQWTSGSGYQTVSWYPKDQGAAVLFGLWCKVRNNAVPTPTPISPVYDHDTYGSVGISLLSYDWIEDIDRNGELTLFDITGKPIAYVAFDEDSTIYLWDGAPVAYLYGSTKYSENKIYSFNGRHLGWFSDGILYDNNGFRVGFTKSTSPYVTYIEPVKYVKYVRPVKYVKNVAWARPAFSSRNSTLPLKVFLLLGANE